MSLSLDRVIRPDPGDVILIRVSTSLTYLSHEAIVRISEQSREAFPDNKVLVLMDGVEVETLSREDIERLLS